MGSGMFDGLVSGLLIIGALLGIAFCLLVWFLYWLASHITIGWV